MPLTIDRGTFQAFVPARTNFTTQDLGRLPPSQLVPAPAYRLRGGKTALVNPLLAPRVGIPVGSNNLVTPQSLRVAAEKSLITADLQPPLPGEIAEPAVADRYHGGAAKGSGRLRHLVAENITQKGGGGTSLMADEGVVPDWYRSGTYPMRDGAKEYVVGELAEEELIMGSNRVAAIVATPHTNNHPVYGVQRLAIVWRFGDPIRPSTFEKDDGQLDVPMLQYVFGADVNKAREQFVTNQAWAAGQRSVKGWLHGSFDNSNNTLDGTLMDTTTTAILDGHAPELSVFPKEGYVGPNTWRAFRGENLGLGWIDWGTSYPSRLVNVEIHQFLVHGGVRPVIAEKVVHAMPEEARHLQEMLYRIGISFNANSLSARANAKPAVFKVGNLLSATPKHYFGNPRRTVDPNFVMECLQLNMPPDGTEPPENEGFRKEPWFEQYYVPARAHAVALAEDFSRHFPALYKALMTRAQGFATQRVEHGSKLKHYKDVASFAEDVIARARMYNKPQPKMQWRYLHDACTEAVNAFEETGDAAAYKSKLDTLVADSRRNVDAMYEQGTYEIRNTLLQPHIAYQQRGINGVAYEVRGYHSGRREVCANVPAWMLGNTTKREFQLRYRFDDDGASGVNTAKIKDGSLLFKIPVQPYLYAQLKGDIYPVGSTEPVLSLKHYVFAVPDDYMATMGGRIVSAMENCVIQ